MAFRLLAVVDSLPSHCCRRQHELDSPVFGVLKPQTAAAHRAQPGFESAFVMNVDGEDGQQRHMGYVQFSSAEAAAAARKVSAAGRQGVCSSSDSSNSISISISSGSSCAAAV